MVKKLFDEIFGLFARKFGRKLFLFDFFGQKYLLLEKLCLIDSYFVENVFVLWYDKSFWHLQVKQKSRVMCFSVFKKFKIMSIII